MSGQRETKPNGGYIASHFATVDHSRRIRQEIFFDQGIQPFVKDFFADINKNQGQFEKKDHRWNRVYPRSNWSGERRIYIVKALIKQYISVVMYSVGQPIKNTEFTQLLTELKSI